MAIRITNFAGIYPKASPRALPDAGAQVAQDVQAGSAEFRPLGQDVTVVANTGVTNPKTIYRLARTAGGAFNTDMTTGWIVKAGDMSLAKAQINNDTTERTFATFDDGSAPPRVYDVNDTTVGRQLGVPAPSTAPALVVTQFGQFSTDDRQASIEAAQTFLRNISKVVIVPVWRGASSVDPTTYRPGTTHDGYVDRDYVPSIDAQEAQQLRVFRLASTGGANSGAMSATYAAQGPSAYQWVFDPQLAGFYKTSPASSPLWPTWAGANNDHWCIPFHAYGLTFDINVGALSGYLQSMEKPGETAGTRLLTDVEVTEIINAVGVTSSQQWTDVAPKLTALRAAVTSMDVLLGGGGIAQRDASLASFYAQSDVSTEIANAVNNCAEALWGLAVQASQYVDYTPDNPGG